MFIERVFWTHLNFELSCVFREFLGGPKGSAGSKVHSSKRNYVLAFLSNSLLRTYRFRLRVFKQGIISPENTETNLQSAYSLSSITWIYHRTEAHNMDLLNISWALRDCERDDAWADVQIDGEKSAPGWIYVYIYKIHTYIYIYMLNKSIMCCMEANFTGEQH